MFYSLLGIGLSLVGEPLLFEDGLERRHFGVEVVDAFQTLLVERADVLGPLHLSDAPQHIVLHQNQGDRLKTRQYLKSFSWIIHL